MCMHLLSAILVHCISYYFKKHNPHRTLIRASSVTSGQFISPAAGNVMTSPPPASVAPRSPTSPIFSPPAPVILPDIFTGCVVYVHNIQDNARLLSRYVVAYGGDVTPSLDESTTHVIAVQFDPVLCMYILRYASSCNQELRAQLNKIHSKALVVEPSWVCVHSMLGLIRCRSNSV